MEDFSFCMPTRFVFGRGAELRAADEVRACGASRALVLYGGASAERSGLIDRVCGALEDAGVAARALGGVRPNPESDFVYRAIDAAREEGADIVLGAGGGSVMDTAKAVAAGAVYDGDFWDFFSGAAPERVLPVGAVPTIAASGSEASGDAVITHSATRLKREMSTPLIVPRFALMNPELTCTLPPYQTACGLVDMFSHLLERYLSASGRVEVTDRLLEGLMREVVEQSVRVMADPADYDARANVMWAATMAHCDVLGVGRAQDWASHDIEYALSSRYGVAHGAGLAAVMPAVLAFDLEYGSALGARARLAQLAVGVWGCEADFADPGRTARAGIGRLRAWCAGLGMPVTLSEVRAGCPSRAGEDPAEAVRAMARETCFAGGRGGTVGGYLRFDEADVAAILELMG